MPGFHTIFHPPRLLELVARCDILINALPGTPATRHLVNQSVFEAMKQGALFINVGRGTTVDEEALCAALRTGKIAGAGIDVVEKEPLDKAHVLWSFENVIITSHMAGVYAEHYQKSCALLADNLRRILSGKPIRNLVDKQRGY